MNSIQPGSTLQPVSGELSIRWAIVSTACLTLLSLSIGASAADKALQGEAIPTQDGDLLIHPINHATLALGWKGLTIYVDPVGGSERFSTLPHPDLILITDVHGDHLSVDTLKAITGENTAIVAPTPAIKRLPDTLKLWAKPLDAGQSKSLLGLKLEAMPAYNLTPDRLRYHAKDRGIGYVLTLADKRVYISGDTEDIPEMRALKEIDVAFLCMNLPYTMTVQQAASAVREFRPRVVYPYHSRGSDVEEFKKLVGDDAGVEVRLRDWYR